MESVVLYAFKSPDLKVSIEAYFNEKGELVIDGYDIGKTVEGYFGDSDYEYILTIPAEESEKLYPILSVDPPGKGALLAKLQALFCTNSCFSDLQKFLTENGLHHTTFTWS